MTGDSAPDSYCITSRPHRRRPLPTAALEAGVEAGFLRGVASFLLLGLAPPRDLVRGGFQPRLPTSLPPPGQQQQPSPLPRRQPVPLLPPTQLHPGAPQVVAPAPAVPLQSPPPSELMDVDPSAGPPSQAVAVQPVLQPLSLGTPKESDTAAPCPAPTQQPSTQRQETLPLFVGPDAPRDLENEVEEPQRYLRQKQEDGKRHHLPEPQTEQIMAVNT
ncbi:uncharacterized protein LOC126416874 [Schistocerca serialis cubense]|uniref:uncharacterized protein LOC126416874 n=1 Tax=Schistocerca serialis cubense TaxID=2023355 RepID=UPI00214EC85D|nr:uncharacterized protein LOC126416874 [Schistocerca serialis cubense]